MARSGYLGFQDLGGDCWFKNIVLKSTRYQPGPVRRHRQYRDADRQGRACAR